MKEILKVLEPGAYTTIQDSGRFGYQEFGVPPSGAIDKFAYHVSNLLLSNSLKDAVLELTIFGPKFEVLNDTLLSITGGNIPLYLNNKRIEHWSSFNVKRGDIIKFGQVESGCRAYLSMLGGIEVPVVMGSRSTYAGAKIGGYNGRPLKKGDILYGKGHVTYKKPAALDKKFIPNYPKNVEIRAILGPQDDFFDDSAIDVFFNSEYTVTSKADRMGYRLKGANLKHRDGVPKSIISEPSLPGGIQVPADGQPLILLVEQTVGGYTKIATIISTDIDLIGQSKPGDILRFVKVDLESAHKAFFERKRLLNEIKNSLELE